MKFFITSITFLFLNGCVSDTNTLAKASLSDIKFREVYDTGQFNHGLEVSFNYHILDYEDSDRHYICTIQFLNLDGSSISNFSVKWGIFGPCELEKTKIRKTIFWPMPWDESVQPAKEELENIRYPIEFYLAIHQKTGPLASRIISRSETFTLKEINNMTSGSELWSN